MSQRSIRVNELIKREISQILHTRYQSETVAITVIDVDVSPDLRNANVYYSVLGDETVQAKARSFFGRNKREIRRLVSKHVVIKYLPQLRFIFDESMQRGTRMVDLLDELDEEDIEQGLEDDNDPEDPHK